MKVSGPLELSNRPCLCRQIHFLGHFLTKAKFMGALLEVPGMPTRLHILGTFIVLALLFFSLTYIHPAPHYPSNPSRHAREPQPKGFPQKIWQKWETPAQGLSEELMRLSKSWIDMNPSYRYELLTSDSSLTYVRDRFRERPDIVRVFEQTTDTILRADLVRYLTLFADGGVYADIDTDCSRPIEDWVPVEYANTTSLLLGVEYDARGGDISTDFSTPVQLCQWTLMAKPGHRVLEHVVDRVIANLAADMETLDSVTSHDMLYVLETTGPRVSTSGVSAVHKRS